MVLNVQDNVNKGNNLPWQLRCEVYDVVDNDEENVNEVEGNNVGQEDNNFSSLWEFFCWRGFSFLLCIILNMFNIISNIMIILLYHIRHQIISIAYFKLKDQFWKVHWSTHKNSI